LHVAECDKIAQVSSRLGGACDSFALLRAFSCLVALQVDGTVQTLRLRFGRIAEVTIQITECLASCQL
jgi:hypothetical protein